MTKYEEIRKKIEESHFLPDILEAEKASLLALHRGAITFKEYQSLRTYADDMFMLLCAFLA